MSEPILRTQSAGSDGVAVAVAHRLSHDEWVGDPARGPWRLRSAMPRRKAEAVAYRVVPIVLDSLLDDLDEREAKRAVRRAIGWWQALLWRAAITLIVRWLVDWLLSDKARTYRNVGVGVAGSTSPTEQEKYK